MSRRLIGSRRGHLARHLDDHGYLVHGTIDTWGELINEAATATWDFCDKNRDGIACVMRTEPSPYTWTILDNRPFGR